MVIVSGPPGSGKTSVSTALASGCERGVHLESDWFFRSIRSGFVAPWLPDAHSQNTAVMYDQFADLGQFEPHVISSDAPAEHVIDTCRAALADGSLVVTLDP